MVGLYGWFVGAFVVGGRIASQDVELWRVDCGFGLITLFVRVGCRADCGAWLVWGCLIWFGFDCWLVWWLLD